MPQKYLEMFHSYAAVADPKTSCQKLGKPVGYLPSFRCSQDKRARMDSNSWGALWVRS